MKYTQKFNLKKPEGTDLVNIDDFNANADIIDAELAKRIINAGNVPSVQAGLDASKPAPGTVGRLYVATDMQILYRDTGTAWQKVGVVKWGDIEGKPSPADIGAETPAGAQAKVEAHVSDDMPHRVTDSTGKVYRWGLAIQDGELGIIYEEVV